MTHPLTNEDCLQIIRDVADYWDHEKDPSTPMAYELMRTAERKGRADMLEQVSKWLEDNVGLLLLCVESELSHRYLESLEKEFIQSFIETMRPQEDTP